MLVAEPRLVATDEQRGTRGGAEGSGDVALGVAHAVGGEAVEVRRGDFLPTVGAEFAVAKIIGDDENDVGAAGGLGGGEREREREKKGSA